MPSTNSSVSSGFFWIRWATSRSPSSNTARQGEVSRLLHLAHPAAQVVGRERHHLGAEAVEEGGVARLVHELGGEEQLDLAAGGGLQERREVGRHALLPHVERAEAPDRVLLRRGRRGQPVLAVHAEVELVGAPVLALPERVELAVVEQLRVIHAASGSRAPSRAVWTPRWRSSRAELVVVAAARPVDPAPEQRDRVELAVHVGELVLHRLGRGQRAGGHAHVVVDPHRHGRRGLRRPRRGRP